MYQKELTNEQLESLHKCKTFEERLVLIKELYPLIPDATQRFMAKDKEPWTRLGFIHNYQRIYRNKRLKNLENKRRLVKKEALLVERVESAVIRSVKEMNHRKHNIECLIKEKEKLIPWATQKLKELHEIPTDTSPLTLLEQVRTAKEIYEMAEIFSGIVNTDVKPIKNLDEEASTFFSNIMNKINTENSKEPPKSIDELDTQLISLEDYASELQETK